MTTTSATTAKVNLAFSIGDSRVELSCSVPGGAARLDDLMPVLQILSDNIVSSAEQAAQEQGVCISCKKGCGACCRQLVPLSPLEARHIARLVNELPEPRQSQIRARFAAAREGLVASGMWQQLEERESWPEDDVNRVGREYFRHGIACPFLEDESCSIHLDRPMTCREYLVTSPAERCAELSSGIEWLPLPAKVWVAAARCETEADRGSYVHWVPLIQALDWAEGHAPPAAEKTGPELLRQVIEALAGTGNQAGSRNPAGASDQASAGKQAGAGNENISPATTAPAAS